MYSALSIKVVDDVWTRPDLASGRSFNRDHAGLAGDKDRSRNGEREVLLTLRE